MNFVFDFVVVGSGFGGSAAALRLAEKGYSVAVLEQGKRYRDQDFPKTNWSLFKYLWMPSFRCFGIQNLSLFRNVLVLSGVGVGGGSLVYANTLVEPGDEFYESPHWKDLASWKAELSPHYQTAKRMLGAATNPVETEADRVLRECARDLGNEISYKTPQVAVYFSQDPNDRRNQEHSDPYFGGKGPNRSTCNFCGGCMVGCRFNAKNSLPKNYLYLAEKLGAKIFAETKVVRLAPALDGGYELETVQTTSWVSSQRTHWKAKQVILAGGVLGTLRLLLQAKHVDQTLPHLSHQLGSRVRTNSEALVGVTQLRPGQSEGIAITSAFKPDQHTQIEPVRYSKGSNFMRILAAPMVDGGGRIPRPVWLCLAVVKEAFLRPLQMLRGFSNRNWADTTIILLVMQNLENQLRFKLGRSILTGFRNRMISEVPPGQNPAPAYLPIANQIARAFAQKTGGIPQSSINEVLLNIPTTAHILGGCAIGKTIEDGVVNASHEVFSYPGLYICDGSTISANLGVNPSLTILAMTERAMSRIPVRQSPR